MIPAINMFGWNLDAEDMKDLATKNKIQVRNIETTIHSFVKYIKSITTPSEWMSSFTSILKRKSGVTPGGK